MISIIQGILNTPTNEIEGLLKPKLKTQTFFKTGKMARKLISEQYDLSSNVYGYYKCVVSWSHKLGVILRRWLKEGIVEIYSKNSAYTVYKKTETEVM